MNAKILAAGVIGFLLGGLAVSIAAQLEEPAHGEPTGIHRILED
ncbi:hypothetical protein [Zhihengliuella salsuginis]|uniref:Methionine and alanine importer, small subunit n=1 Tax=Zhihengliuella salsuginis TaxID=578222 RepID=A0ABQ3GGW2_9MICC|nr:hypothetical protein [Zhihengliuella salsuginis]GHD05984.1 hypothetical protein GCM10008096_15440 [Zhihengliuella salsuginis]